MIRGIDELRSKITAHENAIDEIQRIINVANELGATFPDVTFTVYDFAVAVTNLAVRGFTSNIAPELLEFLERIESSGGVYHASLDFPKDRTRLYVFKWRGNLHIHVHAVLATDSPECRVIQVGTEAPRIREVPNIPEIQEEPRPIYEFYCGD